jgi:hypothetical protein
MSSAAIAAIDAVQPYGGRNDVLWHLHELNNIDKHRLILTVGSALHSFDALAPVRERWPKDFHCLNPVVFLGVKDSLYPLEPTLIPKNGHFCAFLRAPERHQNSNTLRKTVIEFG